LIQFRNPLGWRLPLNKMKKPALKAGTKRLAGKNGKSRDSRADKPVAKPVGKPVASIAAKPASKTAAVTPAPPSEAKIQFEAFERGIQILHQRNFRQAKEMFEKARNGPSREIASNAALHVGMCERRLAAPGPEPKSAEEHYDYAVALINLRNLGQARRHLEIALGMDPRADHVHYALGVCLGLSGDAAGAYDSLKRAIELHPRNRMVARQDSDFDALRHQPQFSRLLFPE
jgi:tetratricopeptide (TPR) repeat protein